MFRRSGKNGFEEHNGLYSEDQVMTPSYNKYKKPEVEIPTGIFETPHHSSIMNTHNPDLAEPNCWPHEHHESEISSHIIDLSRAVPETTLGAGVSFKGELAFERLLRIDGSFEGSLVSAGMIIIGPQGSVKADINLSEALIQGHVEGNITVTGIVRLLKGATVFGDIKAASLIVEEGVRILGHLYIMHEEAAILV
ncbi:Uncharacterized protein CLAVI_000511 [Candidatus Clavichlamydia salmonicola]|uniref:bactofilin family protein n=1 Tax=Candidatus Clavichlamydia salmonicola TaxID=469812 RepID=UPI001891A7E0|nr:polymer-forming cytoskeletal protein [Candidatus Clavichlamydia salmonicola]MBF5050889.1 Uncharacterized protein [Candidatus Clavichlamydia salmonicola]